MPYPDDMRHSELDEYEITADMREAREVLRRLDALRVKAREFGEFAAQEVEDIGLLDLTFPFFAFMGATPEEVTEWSRETLDEHISTLTNSDRLRDLKERAGE